MATGVGLSRGRGGGDAGSLTPICSATRLRCMVAVVWGREGGGGAHRCYNRVRTTTTTRVRQVCDLLFFALRTPWPELSGQPTGAALRRRQRRLRSWWRHEQLSIAAALATVMHHSSGKVHTANGAPRSQTTATSAREVEARDARSPTGTEVAPTGGAARHPRGAPAEERPQPGAQGKACRCSPRLSWRAWQTKSWTPQRSPSSQPRRWRSRGRRRSCS